MSTEVRIETERIDDIPLLVQQQAAMGIPTIIDEVIRSHGNRQGLSVGWTVAGWLSYILSEGDHRMSYVEPWAERRLETLKGVLPGEVTARAFSDDRLGDVLCELSDDARWAAIEQGVGQQLLRVYALPCERVRLDSTTAALYHDTEGSVLFRYGMSKDHRADLPQVKVMLGALDPLGMPLATLVVPGNRADDGLYVPAIQQVRAVVQRHGLLYIGDSKIEALAVRAELAAKRDYYLMPLSQKGEHAALLTALLQPVEEQSQALTPVYRPGAEDEEASLVAQAYETTRWQEAEVQGEGIRWLERILVVYSPTLAEQSYQGLQARLRKAQVQLLALTPAPGRGVRAVKDLAALQTQATAILQQQRVTGLLTITYQQHLTQRQIRKHKERPARTEEIVRYQVQVTRNEQAIEAAARPLGWRLYLLNALADQLSLADAILAYRNAPTIERDFARLKGRPLGLRPFFVQREDHVCGLIRLLSLALRVLTVTEFVVRRALQAGHESLPGLYPGNPKQTTSRPTTDRLLAAFKEITLTLVQMPGQLIRHVTPLTPLQLRILALLGLSPSIYSDLSTATLPYSP